MSAFPAGTVTFCFTDIEGSTELLKRLGDGYGEVLSEHRKIVRESCIGASGTEIDTQGDAFFFAFPRAREAVIAAVEVQRRHAAHDWPDGLPVRVRIGLHTGEPAVGEEGYHGLDVVRAARICTAGRGGQVVLSETTRALAGSVLPEGVTVSPIGERRLKGLDEPERVYQLEIDGLPVNRPEPEPAVPDEPGRPGDDLGKRLGQRIEESVLRTIEAGLGKFASPVSGSSASASNVDELAARGASLDEKIRARVDAALKASGLHREDK